MVINSASHQGYSGEDNRHDFFTYGAHILHNACEKIIVLSNYNHIVIKDN